MSDTAVSSAFANAPMNPNVRPTMQDASTNSDANAQPQAQPAPMPDTQSSKLNSWLNILNSPDSANQQNVSTQSSSKEEAKPIEQVTPPTSSVNQMQPQYPSADFAVQYSNMQQQNQMLQAKLQQQEEVIQNLMQAQQDYKTLKNKVDANNIQFGELSTIDQEDAKAIAAGIMNAMAPQFDQLKQSLQQQQKYTQESNQWQQQRFAQQKAQDTLRRIIDKHPDFVALQSDPNYLQFVQQRDGSSSWTYDNHAAYEFQQGNADYIIDLINRYKKTIPTPSDITSVAPVQTASVPETPAGQQPELPTLREINQWMQMRQITQDQYRELLKRILAAKG